MFCKKSFCKEEVQTARPRKARFWGTDSSALVDKGKQLSVTNYGILKLKPRVVVLNLLGVLRSK